MARRVPEVNGAPVMSQRTAIHRGVAFELFQKLRELNGYPALLEAVGSREEAEEMRLHLERLLEMGTGLSQASDDVQLRERDAAAEVAKAVLWLMLGGLCVAFFWSLRSLG